MNGEEQPHKHVGPRAGLGKVDRQFGGWVSGLLSFNAIQKLRCAAKGCEFPAVMQYPTGPAVPGYEGYRVLCAAHSVFFTMMIGGILGDPSALSEGRVLAGHLGVNFEAVLAMDPGDIGVPEKWCCVRCSGGMLERPIVRGEEGQLPYTVYYHHCTDNPREGIL